MGCLEGWPLGWRLGWPLGSEMIIKKSCALNNLKHHLIYVFEIDQRHPIKKNLKNSLIENLRIVGLHPVAVVE